MLRAPFRSGTAHVMFLWLVSCVGFIPGWKQKVQQGANGPKQERTDAIGKTQECWHEGAAYLVLCPLRRELEIHASSAPPRRMPPSSSSRRAGPSLASAIDWIRYFR
jgi:hypothetical protein